MEPLRVPAEQIPALRAAVAAFARDPRPGRFEAVRALLEGCAEPGAAPATPADPIPDAPCRRVLPAGRAPRRRRLP